MNVIAPRTLRAFWQVHNQAEEPLREWEKRMRKGSFINFNALRESFPSADYIKIDETEVVVFNIGGNKYRLIASIKYETQTVFIKRIMTHAEYDTWNARGKKL